MTRETMRPLFIIGEAQKLFYIDSTKIDNLQQCTHDPVSVSRNRVGYIRLETKTNEEYYIPIIHLQDCCNSFDILHVFDMHNDKNSRGYTKLKGMSYKKNGNTVLLISSTKQVNIA